MRISDWSSDVCSSDLDKNRFYDGLTTYYDDTGAARLITVSDFQQGGVLSPYFLQDVRDEAGNVVIPSFQGLGLPLPGGFDNSGSSGRVTGRPINDWKPADDILLHGNHTRGYPSGNLHGLAYGRATKAEHVHPVQLEGSEVGI